jgi:hypothetical protein
MYVCVYLPQELDLIHKRGPWSEQFGWWLSDTLQFEPVCRPDDQQLLGWVAPDQDLSESFPTDGRLYVFSALRPAAPPQGSLRLTLVTATRLSLWVIVLLVLAGVLATPLSAGRRVLAVGALVVAFVLCGVFFPLVIWQICDGLLAAAVVLVAVIWTAWYVVYTLPRVRARRRAARPQQPPPGVPPGAPPGPPSRPGGEAPPGPPPVTAPTAPSAPQSPPETPGKPDAQGPADAAPQPPEKPEAKAPPESGGNPFGRQSGPSEEGGQTDE